MKKLKENEVPSGKVPTDLKSQAVGPPRSGRLQTAGGLRGSALLSGGNLSSLVSGVTGDDCEGRREASEPDRKACRKLNKTSRRR